MSSDPNDRSDFAAMSSNNSDWNNDLLKPHLRQLQSLAYLLSLNNHFFPFFPDQVPLNRLKPMLDQILLHDRVIPLLNLVFPIFDHCTRQFLPIG